PLPTEYGGQGASCLQSCHAMEALALGSIDGGFGLSWGAHMIIGALPIALNGSEEQKKKYLPKLASGEWMGGLGLTEAASGSDAAGLLTKAEPTQGGWILNGSKLYITNGPVGHVFLIMARTQNTNRGPLGISCFIVEKDSPGFSVSKVLRKLGHHTSMTAELVFENVFVPEENLLGPLNSGFLRIGKSTLEWERTVLISGLLGAMDYAFRASWKYAKEREQFKKPIFSFPVIQEKLSKLWVYLQASRRTVYFVAKGKDRGLSLPMYSSLGKLLTSELGEESASECVQIFGGYGFMKEYHVERFYRDVKLATIGGGTSEIQRSILFSLFEGIGSMQEDLGGAPSNASAFLSSIQNLLSIVETSDIKKHGQILEFSLANLILIYVTIVLGYKSNASSLEMQLLEKWMWSKYGPSILSLKILYPQAVEKLFQESFQLNHSPSLSTDWVRSFSE
ncbi:MAG: acyl-CoA dehydrogenase, partial [Cyclobacteriaceae bacterium]|nr:acyl-CoA dehydrogenase [Cyclobacteriaceae bacterium]